MAGTKPPHETTTSTPRAVPVTDLADRRQTALPVYAWLWPLLAGEAVILLHVSRILAGPYERLLFAIALVPAAAGAVVGLWRHRPAARPWRLLSAGLVTMFLAEVAFNATAYAFPVALPHIVGDVGYLVGILLICAGVVGLVRRQGSRRGWDVLLDSGVLVVGVAVVLWQVLTLVTPNPTSTVEQLVRICYPLVLASAFGVVVQLVLLRGGRIPSGVLLAAGSSLGLVASLVYVAALQRGTYEPGSWWMNVISGNAQLLLALAVLHPSMHQLARPGHFTREDMADRRVPVARVTALGVALLGAPAAITVTAWASRGGEQALPLVLTALGLGLLVLLVFGRLVLLLRDRARIHRELRRTAQQQAVVAGLGRLALARETPTRLFEQAVTEVARLLEVEHVALLECVEDGEFRLGAAIGWPEHAVGRPYRPAGGSMAHAALTTDSLVVVEHPDNEIPGTRPLQRPPVLTVGLGMLVGSPGRPLGVLLAHSTSRHGFDDDERHFVEALTNVLAAAVLDHQANEERQRLLKALLTATERERARVAADLHDGPLQQLSTLALHLHLLRSRMERDEGPATAFSGAVDTLGDRLNDEVRSLRQLMTGLRPATLDDHGLVPALELQARMFSESTGMPCTVEVEPDSRLPLQLLDDGQETVMYRVAQESLSNVAKHARARSVTVRISTAKGRVILSVGDDGVGFEPEREHGGNQRHLGLVWMRERVELAGGRWSLASAPGRGTTVQAELVAGATGDRTRATSTG